MDIYIQCTTFIPRTGAPFKRWGAHYKKVQGAYVEATPMEIVTAEGESMGVLEQTYYQHADGCYYEAPEEEARI